MSELVLKPHPYHSPHGWVEQGQELEMLLGQAWRQKNLSLFLRRKHE